MSLELFSPKSIKSFVLGNEAIARGLIEGGLQFACSYPGTPTSEILETIEKFSKEFPVYYEWSSNEKVALESCIAASLTGIRCAFSAKHVGLNVASDALMTLPYMGVVGGLVLVIGDDPSLHSSQNEQDTRYYGLMSSIPILEPSNVQEAYQMSIEAFELSEKFQLPVIIRITTRIAHSRESIEFNELQPNYRIPVYQRNKKYTNVPAIARKNHYELVEKRKKIEDYVNNVKWNTTENKNNSKFGIITSGISYTYVIEAVELLELPEISILKFGLSNPIAEKTVRKFLMSKEKVIIIEEVEPVLEKEIRVIAQANSVSTIIYGKKQGFTPYVEELNTRKVIEALQKFLGIEKFNFKDYDDKTEDNDKLIPTRLPVLCPGCPHRASYVIINRALGKSKSDAIFASDIGCYSLGVLPPLNTADTILDMGASISMANGFAHSGIENPVIAVIGDSTFWHSGLSGLANAIYNNANITIFILDNLTTAMTGMQQNPSTKPFIENGKEIRKLVIEDVCKAMGADTVVIDPYEVKESIKTTKEMLKKPGVKVIVSRRECITLSLRRKTKQESFTIDQEKCIGCSVCVDLLGCPAMMWNPDNKDWDNPHPLINGNLCGNCSLCSQICAKDAIHRNGFEAIVNKKR
ncbi:MAG: indolepyruvate ferredoxin oxidoreductase subunit alpha [Candidatus Thorarchaeota archaeon]